MTGKCTDEHDGVLLFPYELGLLSEEERERFERHLLHCEYCHQQVLAFEPYAAVLQAGRAMRLDFSGDREWKQTDRTVLSRLKEHLWPRVPFPLRPAVLIGLVAVLLYPAISWLGEQSEEKVTAVPVLVLSPMRTAVPGEVVSGGSGSLVISIPFLDAEPDRVYVIRVKDDSAQLLYEEESVQGFDPTGWRHLFFSDGLLPGNYRLSVIERGDGADSVVGDYWFSVQP